MLSIPALPPVRFAQLVMAEPEELDREVGWERCADEDGAGGGGWY